MIPPINAPMKPPMEKPIIPLIFAAVSPPGGVYFLFFSLGSITGFGFGFGGGCKYCYSGFINCVIVGLSRGSELVACSTSLFNVGFAMFLEYGTPVSISANITPRL